MPYVIVENGFPRVEATLPDLRRWTRIAIMDAYWEDMSAFDDQHEYRLRLREIPEYGLVARFLARTIFNPWEDLEAEWEVVGEYSAESVRSLVEAALPKDDDILQQWFDAPEVTRLLHSARTFSDMALAVRAICGEHEEDSAVAAYVARVLGTRPDQR